jgi:hypothetical protein
MSPDAGQMLCRRTQGSEPREEACTGPLFVHYVHMYVRTASKYPTPSTPPSSVIVALPPPSPRENARILGPSETFEPRLCKYMCAYIRTYLHTYELPCFRSTCATQHSYS